MKVFNKDWLIDLQKCILWQYDKSKKISDIIINKETWYKNNVTDFITNFFWNIFNLRTADDFGLNVWGKLLNFPRQIVLTSGEHAGEVYNLSKEQYRFLLIGQILKFKMNCTISEINNYLNLLFPNNNNTCYVVDNQDMSISYVISGGYLTEEIQTLVDNYEFLPRPAGVKISVGISNSAIFRLEVMSEGYSTTQMPEGVQVVISKNGSAVEPIISDNGFEITVTNEDVIAWQITYNGNVIDSQSNITISQNTTQQGYISRLLKLNIVPEGSRAVISSATTPSTQYVQNGVIYTISGNANDKVISDDGIYILSKSKVYIIVSYGNGQEWEARRITINEMNEDINTTIHLLPVGLKVKSVNVYDNRNTPLIDILETEIDETGSYNITLKGEQGGIITYSDRDINYYDDGYLISSAGGILSFDMQLSQNDRVVFKSITGGYGANTNVSNNNNYYIGGLGIGLWINDELIAVVGGGANGGNMLGTPSLGGFYFSAGGGGANGGLAYTYTGNNFLMIYSSGFSVSGTKGNSIIENQDACGCSAYLNLTTRTSGYGGSSYIKDSDSRVSNIVEVYGARESNSSETITQGNRKEGRIIITKNS